MNDATISALKITALALPIMFATTGVFAALCKLLCLLFPEGARNAEGEGKE